MGVFASYIVDAWRRAEPRCANDLRPTQTRLCQSGGRWFATCLIACAGPVFADSYRIATFAAPLSRDGPGLLLRDLRKGDDPTIAAIIGVIDQVAPDIILLTDFDYDLDGQALDAFADMLERFPYRFAALPNAGMPTGLDMDGDGYSGDARDAQGYGRFSGDGGMAVLSRYPIGPVTDFSATLWKDVVGATMPSTKDGPFPSVIAQDTQRLSSAAHWVVPILPPDALPFHLLVWSATAPVFDGPEDRNGLRNRDELRLWENLIDTDPPDDFIVIGNANLDPADGEGLRAAMSAFLARDDLQDPLPISRGGQMAADPEHIGDPALDTADWPDRRPGNLRVSYVLPSREWTVQGAGVFWPARDDPLAMLLGDDGLLAGPHRLVWTDVARYLDPSATNR